MCYQTYSTVRLTVYMYAHTAYQYCMPKLEHNPDLDPCTIPNPHPRYVPPEMRKLVIPEQSPTAPPSVRYEDESTAPIYPKFMTTKVDDTRRKKAALAMAASQVGQPLARSVQFLYLPTLVVPSTDHRRRPRLEPSPRALAINPVPTCLF